MTRTTINITPVGLSTPEGVERVTKAQEAFEQSHAEVANQASQFIHRYMDEIKAVIVRSDDPDAVEDYKELLQTIERREQAQEEFLRAVAGAPSQEAR
jgi:tetratricopeptide (TPR) repeat protein